MSQVYEEYPYEKQLESILGMEIMQAIVLLNTPKQGVIKQDVEKFCHDARWDLVSRTRKRMEASRTELHFIPYGTVSKWPGDGKKKSTLSYKRPDQNNGESRLAGMRSIGFAGHVDSVDNERSNKGVIYAYQTLRTSFIREVDEELKFWHPDLGKFVTIAENPEYFCVEAKGFIYDTTDDVGKTHLGVYFDVEVQPVLEVSSGEDQIEDVKWQSGRELDDTIDAYENWSKFIISADLAPVVG
jgi:predicted NUDIX family phosphoesterase